MAERQRPADRLPLKPLHFLMLLTLVDGERHAYGIKKDLAARGAHRDVGPGTLYRTIAQLIDAGLIDESDRRPVAELDDERRRYYKLTPFGRRVVVAEAHRLDDLVAAARLRKLIPERGGA
jgi:DNA-binding PadR family transcriptional regulator